MSATDPRTARWLRRLPKEAWSPGLNRTVKLSEEEWWLIRTLMDHPGTRSQTKWAELAGYASQGAVSKAFRRLHQLGLIALLTTRGWAGRTLVWVRSGVTSVANIPPLTTVLRTLNESLTVPELSRDGGDGMIHTPVMGR